MSSDSPPDDVRLPLDSLLSVSERCAAVFGPAHLEHARVPLDALDAQAGARGAARC